MVNAVVCNFTTAIEYRRSSIMILLVVFLLLPFISLIAILRQRILRHDLNVDHSLYSFELMEQIDGLEIPADMEPTTVIHPRPNNQNRGKFIGFLVFLVLFFILLSMIVSYNFFTSQPRELIQKTIMKKILQSSDCKTTFPTKLDIVSFDENNRTLYQFPITTTSPRAQQLFAQGLLHLYGFNQQEALRNFYDSLLEDSLCIMCHWGIAAAVSPNLNDVMTEEEYHIGYHSIRSAIDLLQNDHDAVTLKEASLVSAMLERFKLSPTIWARSSQQSRDLLEWSYVKSLQQLYEQFADDDDIACFLAESLLGLTPWSYFTANNELSDTALNAFQILQKIIFLNSVQSLTILSTQFMPLTPKHPLALHLYLHVSEQFYSPYPINSSLMLIAADTLFSQSLSFLSPEMPRTTFLNHVKRNLIHSNGHLLHMPSHAYYRTGLYDMCIASSSIAVTTDSFYQQNCLTPYLPSHNIAMLVVCAIESGNLSLALSSTIYQVSSEIPALQATRYMTSMVPWPQDIIFTRFGDWRSVLSLHKKFQSNSEMEIPFFSEALTLYTGCLSSISLLYTLHDAPLSSNILKNQSCLTKLISVVHYIPEDTKDKSHYFYPYHREIGSILIDVTHAAASLLSARHLTRKLIDESPTISSWSYRQTLDEIFHSYHEALTSLNHAVLTQRSFHYMEPEGFYLSLQMCYIPLLQEVWSFQTFLQELSQLVDYSIIDKLLFKNITFDDIWSLYDLERKRHYPVQESLWHQRSLLKFTKQIERYNSFKQEYTKNQVDNLLTWYQNEYKLQWRLLEDWNSTNFKFDPIGSCCELLYC